MFCGHGGPRRLCEGLGGTGWRFEEGLPLGYDLLTGSSRMSSSLEGDRVVALQIVITFFKVCMFVYMCL